MSCFENCTREMSVTFNALHSRRWDVLHASLGSALLALVLKAHAFSRCNIYQSHPTFRGSIKTEWSFQSVYWTVLWKFLVTHMLNLKGSLHKYDIKNQPDCEWSLHKLLLLCMTKCYNSMMAMCMHINLSSEVVVVNNHNHDSKLGSEVKKKKLLVA